MTKEITTAGPAVVRASTPVRVKIPVPITTPMPKPTRWRAESRCGSRPTPASSPCSEIASTDFVLNSCRATTAPGTHAAVRRTRDVPRARAHPGGVFDVDWMGLLTREVLRERVPALVAEACAWSVGLSDQPHHLRHRGRLVATGMTIGVRAASGQPLSGEEDGRLELGDARAGSFADALNAVAADGSTYADRLDREVLEPFCLQTCVLAAERARDPRRRAWAELLDELGEDGADLIDVVRAGDWETPLRIEAEHLLLAALADVPLAEVEAEGLPLSVVRAAEAAARSAVPEPAPVPTGDELTGALFLAEAVLRASGLQLPVPPDEAGRLLELLLTEGLDPEHPRPLLVRLPVVRATAVQVAAMIAAAGEEP